MPRRIESDPMHRRRTEPTWVGRRTVISVVGLEVEARIEAGDLLAITVEQQRGPSLGEQPVLADPPLGRLAPAGMIDRGVDVGIEAVFACVLQIPRGRRLL